LHLGDAEANSLGRTVDLQAETLDATRGRANNLGRFRGKVVASHDLHVMVLEIGERLRRCPDENEVVDVGHVTRAVKAKVRRRVDAISG
jgi:hypothetical protein